MIEFQVSSGIQITLDQLKLVRRNDVTTLVTQKALGKNENISRAIELSQELNKVIEVVFATTIKPPHVTCNDPLTV